MDSPQSNPNHATSERRRSDRIPTEGRACLELGEAVLEAAVRDSSGSGFLLSFDGPVEFDLIVAGESAPVRVRLMRCQSLPGGESAWGVQRVDAPR